jgi:hypothetical protein
MLPDSNYSTMALKPLPQNNSCLQVTVNFASQKLKLLC